MCERARHAPALCVSPSAALTSESVGALFDALSHKAMMAEARAIQRGEAPLKHADETVADEDKEAEDGEVDEGGDGAAGGGSGDDGGNGGGESADVVQQEEEEAAAVAAEEEEEKVTPPLPPIVALRKHLWTLVPKLPLLLGGCCSMLLTSISFLAPYLQGKLFDVAVDAYHNRTADHNRTAYDNRTDVNDAFTTQILPTLGILCGVHATTWLLEVAVGILFAVAAHTALTRLRVAMFANLVQQDVAFYDRHVSGEVYIPNPSPNS